MTTILMARFFALLTIVADLFVLFSVFLLIASRASAKAERLRIEVRSFLGPYGLALAGVVAVVCTLGSLYLSEVANFVPCKLCWYQRMAMYPMAVILPVAAFMKAKRAALYVLPVPFIGGSISIYHYLLERFPQWSSSASCDPTAPCTVVWIWEFHFISIPFMALSGFAAIATLLLWALPVKDKEVSHERSFARGTSHGSFETS